MSQPAEKIPIEKIKQLSTALRVLHESLEKAVEDYEAAGIDSAKMDGWQTLHRGLVYIMRQVRKIAGPTSKAVTLDVDAILMDHHLEKKRKAQAVKAADDAVLNAAETAATYAPKRKRKP
jgi:hypothetical protein